MNHKKYIRLILLSMLVLALFCTTALATGSKGDVAAVVEETWTAAAGQIKTVVEKVVFPALDMVLTIAFFGKLGMSYFDCAPVKAI